MIPPLELEYIDGHTWKVTEAFSWTTQVEPIEGLTITAPKGFITDFNSTPRVLWRILPPTDFAQAGVIHDVLYRNNGISRMQADLVHREILIALKAPKWKIEMYYQGLLWGGWVAWNRYRRAEKS